MFTYKSRAWVSGIAILLFVFLLNGFITDVAKRTHTDYIDLKDDWTITGDLEFEHVNIDELVFDQVNLGDEFECSCILPEQKIVNPVLKIYTIHYAVSIYLDDELLYEYGWNRIAQGKKMIGYGYQIIPLPEEYCGRTLRMVGHVTSNNAFTSFNVPRICSGSESVKRLIVENSNVVFVVIFLVVFGVVLITASLIFSIKNQKFTKLVCIGAFSFGIATWSLCSSDLIFLFTYNPLTKVYLEYISLYTCPIPFILYFYDDVMGRTNKFIKFAYLAILYAQSIFIVLALVLHFMNIIPFPDMLIFDHAILLCIILFMIVLSVHDILRKRFTHFSLLIAMAIMLLFGLFDVIRYNIQKYVVWFQGDNYVSSLYLGTFIFIFAQIFDFCSEISRNMYKAVETETLARLAYTDCLTGIANRRKCEEEMELLEKRDTNYGIFSFDLNNLKITNDSLGHEKGDKLICRFAQMLLEIFKESALVGRMGGDEFIAIIPDADVVDINLLIRQINENINASMAEEIPLSTAYGYCEKNEFRSLDSKGIYRKADARMYDMKMNMKK